jgi:GT2 family glycosyltransferase
LNPSNEITLSVIIVNYNVAYFLEQCLNAVYKSAQTISVEVFVVDNRSSDNSNEMVLEKFPSVILIQNKENVGFSRANNQAMRIAKGKYVLLLNPDTVVEESTFEKIVSHMESDPKIGGLGVRMVDGKGNFLPESKRGLPTPAVAFYKIFGLASLFKKSKKFGKYHLTYLNEFATNEVEILSGAFMCMRASTLNEVGLLDETFFMYGEDIDLSYRILKGGYKNVYFPETTIIHYKGESTKKSSVNYVFVFYKAMIIFAKKHFTQNNAAFFSFAIYLGIYLRATLALVRRMLEKVVPVLWSGGVLLLGLFALTHRWRMHDVTFPEIAYDIVIPFYFLTWTCVNLIMGAFDAPFKIGKFAKSTVIGTLVILVIYALMPKDFQFSRLYILAGAAWYFAWVVTDKLLQGLLLKSSMGWLLNPKKKFLILGDQQEFKRLKNLLIQNIKPIAYIHGVYKTESYPEAKCNLEEFPEKIDFSDYNEIIFSAKDLDAAQIISWMSQINAAHLDFKIAQPDTDFIIGSNSIETTGETYRVNINNLAKPENLRSKRFFDLILGALLLILSPVLIWLYGSKWQFYKNIYAVILSKRTWVGFYAKSTGYVDPQLPRLKQGILNPLDGMENITSHQSDKLNLIYARDFSILKDAKIIAEGFRHLDRKV